MFDEMQVDSPCAQEQDPKPSPYSQVLEINSHQSPSTHTCSAPSAWCTVGSLQLDFVVELKSNNFILLSFEAF